MKWMHASVVFTSHHAEKVLYRLRLGYLSMKAAKGWVKMHWTDLSLTEQCTLQCPSGNTGWKWLVRRPSNKVSPSRLVRTRFLGPAMFNRIGQRLPCRSSFGNHWLWWLRTVSNPSEVPPLTLLEMRYKELNTPWLLYWRVWTEEADSDLGRSQWLEWQHYI